MALAISLNESQSRLEETLTTGADAITNAVSGTHVGLNGALDQKAADLAASLSAGQARLEEALGHRTGAIIGAVTATHDRLADTLDEKTMALAISLDDSQSRFDSALEARSNAHPGGRLPVPRHGLPAPSPTRPRGSAAPIPTTRNGSNGRSANTSQRSPRTLSMPATTALRISSAA